MFRHSWVVLGLLLACGGDPPVDSDAGSDAGPDATSDSGTCVDRCAEPECVADPACGPLENTAATCSDGLDNDGDGFADCRDFDCSMNPEIDVCGPENSELRCTDGVDNDNNDFVDCADNGCRDFSVCQENDATSCSDGEDNDADGLTDCDDLECLALSVCDGTRLRLVAANLTSGGNQTYDAGHGIRIMDGLDGDVFLVQEMLFGDNSDAALAEFTRQVCGETCEYFRGNGDLIPNGIVSRYPIVDAGVWDDPETDTREFAWARINVPGASDLWAVSVHLLTSSGAARAAQARALAGFVVSEVPDTDLLVIGGDFNAAGGPLFAELAVVVNTDSLPTDQSGNSNTNAPRSRRLDAVLVSDSLQGREVPVQIGDASFEGGFVVDTRVFDPIADLAPAEATDSGVAGMQHMAVIRDFVLRGI